MARAYFTPAFFDFIRQLRLHNDRAWFEANKKRYETQVRDPLLGFIADFGPRLRRISVNFLADPRPVGGSMFRIYRDIRFSRDKSPYKTNAAIHFPHRAGKDTPAPSFYLQLGPDEVFGGVGIYHPDPKTLEKVRDAIVAHPDRWKRAVSGKAFRDTCHLWGNTLKNPPRGYDPQHALIEDLKRTDFVAMTSFSEHQACSPDFMDAFAKTCTAASPFAGFLTTAVGLPY